MDRLRRIRVFSWLAPQVAEEVCDDCGRPIVDGEAVPFIGPFGELSKLCADCNAKLPGHASE